MKIILKLLIACAVVLICNTKLLAQDENNTDSIAQDVGDLASSESIADTVLNRHEFKIHHSVQEYRNDRDFGYMKYLDSLLRQTKDLKADTFSMGNATSPGERKARQRSREPGVPTSNIFKQPIVKIILWVLAFGLIGFIVSKLFLGENFFRRNRVYENISDNPKDDENISDPSGYDKLIAQAVMMKNYRLAIRFSYLQILQMLSASGLVQFSADKTNYQYVNELRGKPYQNDFAGITLNYEYVWYGKFDISEEVYKRLSAEYKAIHQKI